MKLHRINVNRTHYGILFLWICILFISRHWRKKRERKKMQQQQCEQKYSQSNHTQAEIHKRRRRIKLQNSKKRNKLIWLGFGCWLRSMRQLLFFLSLHQNVIDASELLLFRMILLWSVIAIVCVFCFSSCFIWILWATGRNISKHSNTFRSYD